MTDAVSKCTVSGPVLHPDGRPAGAGRVTFTLSERGTQGQITVMPIPVTTVIDGEGNMAVDLWPNARGMAGSTYAVGLQLTSGQRMAGWTISVPDAPDANLADISCP